MAAKQLAHLSKKPQNPPIASKTSHHLWAHHHPEVFASHLTTMRTQSAGTAFAHSPKRTLSVYLTLPSDVDVSPREVTCHSKPWGQTLNQELTSQWRFQFPLPFCEKKKKTLQVSPHESRTKNHPTSISGAPCHSPCPCGLRTCTIRKYSPDVISAATVCRSRTEYLKIIGLC